MKLRDIIEDYIAAGKLDDVIYYIELKQTYLQLAQINDALRWAGKNPKDYSGRYKKIDALLEYLKYEYAKNLEIKN